MSGRVTRARFWGLVVVGIVLRRSVDLPAECKTTEREFEEIDLCDLWIALTGSIGSKAW